MNKLLDIQNLSKHYDGFDLRDVTISVPAGTVVGFIGSNGAGKTTTIKAALGMINVDGGNIELLGKHNDSPKDIAQAKQDIGVVLDSVSFPENISVSDAGDIMKSAYKRWNQSTFDKYLRDFELDGKKTIKELSRGMGMKLTLACALSHDPTLLILDEATAGLDPLARDDALELLREFMKDESHGILISSHITTDLEKIADYIVCIDDGRIVFSLEKDAITDLAGVAQCRAPEFEEIIASGFFTSGEMHYIQHSYGTSVLIPDRFAFMGRFPHIAIDKANIDQYMGLILKGAIQ